ncbi:MAG TPA: hypothetical protein IAB58_04310 [Candidatus Pelethosoma merdigallinarum]|nr:hypothetical protein [Candidatus Pelethosoma merdigallinarum]
MKKIIFLVDTSNSKFLIINNNGWELPSLITTKNIYDEDIICEKYQNKFKHGIRDITIIEETTKYIFVKCLLNTKLEDKKQYKIGVINEIMPLIKNELHYQLLFNMSLLIEFEILNDSFWLGIILTTADKIQNEILKALLTDFLLFSSSSFCEEVITYKFGELKDPNYVSDKQVKDLRKNYFKKCPLYNSKTIKNIIEEMGIDFENYVFDNVLFYIDDELIDINSRTWLNRKKENFELYNGIILSPRRWIKNFHPQLNEFFEELRKPYVDEFIKRFDKKETTYKSYSSKKIFNNDLSNDEKIYILQRIGLLKTTMFFSKLFNKNNFITISEEKNIKVSFDSFLLKVKAALIEMLWNDKKQNNIPFLNLILENYPKEICEEFFPVNRKCRDNLHYGFHNELTNEELGVLNQNQDKYLDYVIKKLEEQLTIKFGVGYKIGLALAKIQYWASN